MPKKSPEASGILAGHAHGEGRDGEVQEIAHRVDASAQAVRRVFRGHSLVDGHLPELTKHRHHGGTRRRETEGVDEEEQPDHLQAGGDEENGPEEPIRATVRR